MGSNSRLGYMFTFYTKYSKVQLYQKSKQHHPMSILSHTGSASLDNFRFVKQFKFEMFFLDPNSYYLNFSLKPHFLFHNNGSLMSFVIKFRVGPHKHFCLQTIFFQLCFYERSRFFPSVWNRSTKKRGTSWPSTHSASTVKLPNGVEWSFITRQNSDNLAHRESTLLIWLW